MWIDGIKIKKAPLRGKKQSLTIQGVPAKLGIASFLAMTRDYLFNIIY